MGGETRQEGRGEGWISDRDVATDASHSGPVICRKRSNRRRGLGTTAMPDRRMEVGTRKRRRGKKEMERGKGKEGKGTKVKKRSREKKGKGKSASVDFLLVRAISRCGCDLIRAGNGRGREQLEGMENRDPGSPGLVAEVSATLEASCREKQQERMGEGSRGWT